MEPDVQQSLTSTVLKVGYVVGMVWLYAARPVVLVVAIVLALTAGFVARAVVPRRAAR